MNFSFLPLTTESSKTVTPNIASVHYAPSGEWGGQKVNCGRYFTSDVIRTGLPSKVTCKNCLKNLSTK